jgi:RHS repeat-associated protein
MVVPGLDGAAAVAVPMPSFDLPVSGARDPAVGVGLLPRFGPYGEALEVPAAPRDAAPSYLWQAASRLETLGGPSSITLMGARPYLAALGLFLAVDPALNGGDALYGFTPGDPVNGVDSTGNANEWSWFWQIVSAVAVVASFVVGMLPGGQWAIPIALGMISTGAQILSAKTQTEPSPALDTFRSVQAWAGLAAMVVMIGPAVVKGVASAGKWTFGKIKAGVARFTRAAAPEANAASRASGSFAAASSASVRTSVEVVAKQGTLARLGAWLARANPKNAYWSGLDKAGKARSYVRSLGKLTGKMTFLGGAYGFQKFAESYVPPWLAAMMEQQQTATS